ncbi:AhpA/YtjB family protein [Rheinheimera sp. MMS21-TC3]|uniref:AhpA/YtjB family protein n=1 Tax=Rheinheimera sp. MMS21-TC3 TaxID=3072790 RepID=UPI0028C4055A|nr:AhpA/YtjB family protein [Rheinheimera sp. MMS21-TC3]WNO61505.1 AhpA/YtjB family protein [Rheinheimera sp. MMS21-TC3]
MQIHSLNANTTSSYIKLLQVAFAVLGIWLLLQAWVVTQQEGKLLLQQQSSQLMRETLITLADTAAYLIENDQLDGLEQLTQNVAASNYLYDVVVYDANGVRISNSENSSPAHQLYHPDHAETLSPMVQPIIKQQQLLGYIKLSLRLDATLNPIAKPWQNLMQRILLMLLFAGAIGFLLRRGFSRFSRQSMRLKPPQA